MIKNIYKSKLLVMTAICTVSVYANTVKAEEISILEILNNSTTRSPDITWSEGKEGEENTIKIGDTYYKYTIANPPTRTKYYEHKTDLTGNITADFIGINHGSSCGGRIADNSTIKYITGNFIENRATSIDDLIVGGVFLNSNITSISNITGDFTGNHVNSTNYKAQGGAIQNQGRINLIGNFIGNTATSENGEAFGGAITNLDSDIIELLSGDFIGNSAIGNSGAWGGAIHNNEKNSIINFVADASDSEDNLQDDVLFQGNYVKHCDTCNKQYEAIYNRYGIINFAANNGGSYTFYDYISGSGENSTINFTANGGIGTLNLYDKAYITGQSAININDAYLINLSGDGLTRSVSMHNLNINADVSLNVDISFDWQNYWSTYDTIDKITGSMTKADGVNFELGRVNILSDMGEEMEAYRGIYNNNYNGVLTDNIGEMSIISDTGTEYDGYNDGRYISIYKQNLSGGLAEFLADANRTSTTYDFTGDENLKIWFGPNGKRAWIEGDTTDKTITINGNGYKISPNIKGISGFLDNFLDNYNNYGENELIINNLTIEGFGGVDAPYVLEGNNITLNNVIFQNSHGRIWNDIYGNIYNSKFINNSYIFDGEGENSGSVYGLNIENYSDIDTINADFIGTHVSMQNTTYTDVYGGAVDNEYKVENLHGNFVSNVVELKDTTGEAYVYGGALYNYGRINSLSGDFLDNHIKVENTENLYVYGGAVYNYGKSILQTMVQDWHGYGSFEEYAQNEWGMSGEDLLAEYGISSEEDVTPEIAMYMDRGYLTLEEFINGEGYDSLEEMLDAYDYSSIREMAEDGDYYDGGITFVADASDSEDTLQDDVLFKGNYIEVDRNRRYEAIYNEGIINFESNNGGSYTFYDYIDGNNATLNFVSDNNEKAIFNLYNNIQNQKDINFQSAYVINMISADDIRVGTSKYSYIQAQNININAALQMMLDIDLKNKKIDHFDAESFTIADGGSINVTQFNIVTDLTGDIGSTTEVEFILSDNSTGLDKITNITEAVGVKYIYSVSFNPKTGAFEFSIIDKKSPEEVVPDQTPSLTPPTTVATVETVVAQIFERDVIISADTNYCIVNVANKKNLWVKTFGSDDDLELDNFNGTIDSKTYGIIGGVDSKVFTYNNRVKVAYGVYGAYVGGKQKYDSYKTTQDSGYLGLSASFRKDRLFSNFTVNGGYITSKASTEWGTDKFDTKAVSIANKTGVDIKVGCYWTVIPALYVAYTGLDTEDYTNRAGVKIENDFTHVATIAPEVKVRRYFGKSFSGYAKASYKHYIYDSKVKANDVILEEMSVKPYIEYGFGAKKTWTDSSTYAEITRRDGGRKGWNVNLGLRLDF